MKNNLKNYLKGRNREEFASRIGTTKNYVNLLVTGARRPSPDLALRIQEATDGNVTVWELLYPDKGLSQYSSQSPQGGAKEC